MCCSPFNIAFTDYQIASQPAIYAIMALIYVFNWQFGIYFSYMLTY